MWPNILRALFNLAAFFLDKPKNGEIISFHAPPGSEVVALASTAKKLKAVAAILSERNQSAAAIAAGMSVRSLRDLQSDPEFVSLLADAKATILASTTNAIVAASIRAVEVLHEALDDVHTPAIDKQWAVALALNLAENAHMREVLEARIAQLENTAKLTVEWEVIENKPKTIEGNNSWPRLT